MYKSILVPIDLAHTEKGKPVIEVARRLADKDTKITLLNVVEEVPSFIAAQVPNNVIENAAKTAEDMLKAMGTAAGMKVDTQVRSGKARTAILHAADEMGADLIVVGSHRPGAADYLIGSTAARVVRHAKCSVLVVR